MTRYDGVVTFEDSEIPVNLGIDAGEICLFVNGKEVAAWSPSECSIQTVDGGVYTINAENESLRFVPSDPVSFAHGLNGGLGTMPRTTAPEAGAAQREVPEPRPITMVMFYALSALTALLGLWALLSLIF